MSANEMLVRSEGGLRYENEGTPVAFHPFPLCWKYGNRPLGGGPRARAHPFGRPGVHQPPEEAAYRKFTRISRATGGVPNRAGAYYYRFFFARRLATGFRVGKGHCRSFQGCVSATYDLQHMGKI